MENENIARLTLDLPTELHKHLKVSAAENGVSMKSLILALVMDWIQKGKASPNILPERDSV